MLFCFLHVVYNTLYSCVHECSCAEFRGSSAICYVGSYEYEEEEMRRKRLTSSAYDSQHQQQCHNHETQLYRANGASASHSAIHFVVARLNKHLGSFKAMISVPIERAYATSY